MKECTTKLPAIVQNIHVIEFQDVPKITKMPFKPCKCMQYWANPTVFCHIILFKPLYIFSMKKNIEKKKKLQLLQ